MGLGRRVRAGMAGAAAVLAAASAALLTAPGASAAPATGLTATVTITFQNVAGDQCQWGVKFNVSIANTSASAATVTSVDVGNYNPLSANGGLAAGKVLAKKSTTTFTGLASYNGPSLGQPCFPVPAPPPLVLTVGTSAGTVTWNQSVSAPVVVTEPQPSGVNVMPGSFDVANCAQYYFQYGATTNYGKQGTVTTNCANDGTKTQFAYFTPTQVPSTGYHYRLVVVEKDGTVLCGQDQFYTGGGTTVPVGSVGALGVAGLAGAGLFLAQRRRRSRRAAA